MNKVFRVIWSEAQGAWVAVSETTKSHSKRSRKSALALALTAGSLMTISGAAVAKGEFVESGVASIAIDSGKCSLNTAADGENSVSIGCGAGAGAEGQFDGSKADKDTSIGYQAGIGVKGKENTAIGSNAGENVEGNDNTAFGVSAGKLVKGSKNVSLGFNSGFQLKGDGNISAGDASGGSIHGDNNVMLGTGAKVKESTAVNRISDTVLIGTRASASSSDNVAIGKDTQATHANSVALGHLSQTREAKSETEGVISYKIGTDTKTYTYEGFFGTASGVVSVGHVEEVGGKLVGAERQIINVAPGAITSFSTDAVNGSQLYLVAEGLNKRIDAIDTSGGGGGGGGGWVLGSKDTAGNSQDLTVAAGKKVTLDAGANMKVTSYQDADGNTVTTFTTTPNVTHNSVTTGDTVMNDNGVTIKGGPSITKNGVDAGDKKITNVADGTIAAGSKDAVNGGQIHDMQVEINKLAGGWELNDGKGGKQQVKAGDTVAIVGGDNINVEFDADGKMVVETTPDVTHNSVTTGDTLMNDNGVTIKDGPSITKNGVDAGDKKITSVAKGDISETSTDAINGSQLNETNNRVTKNEGDIKNIQNGKDGMFQVSQDYNAPAPKPTGTKSAAGGAGAVASGNYSTALGNDAKATADNSVALGYGSVADRENTVSVGSPGAERQITNVAPGTRPTDGVNVSQLKELDVRVNNRIDGVNKKLNKVDKSARAGVAAAMAAGALPQAFLPGKSMLTMGGATYRGETALAIGVSRMGDNARTVVKINATTDSRGNAGAAIGAGWHW